LRQSHACSGQQRGGDNTLNDDIFHVLAPMKS
jgi:hypothetical protein